MCRSVLLTPARPRGAEKARSLSAVIPRKKPSMSGTAMEMRHPMWYRRRRREIRGVVVVAKGGGDPVIQRQIQEAVMALFHVEAHKIKVMKMK